MEDSARLDAWQLFGVGLALVFVIEGVMPFIAPQRWRDMVRQVAQLDDRTLRAFGLFSMLLGLFLLYLFN
jgi:uncharacterized protein YjeT (DUF2065 family)